MPNYKVGDVIQQQNLQTFPIDASHVTLKKRHRHVENGILNLGPVEWSDGGQYSCHSWKQDRISLKSWTLIVLDSQQNISSKIFYEGIPLQVTVKQNPYHYLKIYVLGLMAVFIKCSELITF
jgi:hypothetical protein